MRAPLGRLRVFETTDVDEARSSIGRTFCPHTLALTTRRSSLALVHNRASVGDIGINYLRYGEEVRITPGLFESFYLVQIPLRGHAQVRVGDQSVTSDRRFASLGSPTLPVDMVWSADCEQLLVRISRSAVEAAADRTADDPVVFHPMVDLSTPAMRSWTTLVRLACDEAEQGAGLLTTQLAISNFEQTMVSGLLAAQPNSTALSPRPVATAPSRAVRKTLELIEDEPEKPWKVADLAARAGVGPRTLQAAFHRERGTTPIEELRRVRLTRARRDLVDGTPTSTSVTEIAARWGFFHLGRFSSMYRTEHGENPSHTLAS